MRAIGKLAPIFREIELQQGVASERYFAETLEWARRSDRLPPWIIGWIPYEKWSDQDRFGVDFNIVTDRGNIRVNVKSSKVRAKLFELRPDVKKKKIIPIVVNLFESKAIFLGKFISKISSQYKSMPKRQ